MRGAPWIRSLALWSMALAAGRGVEAAAAEPVPDVDLLEFLGSVDTEEPGWHEFLETNPPRPGRGKVVTPAPGRRAPDAKEVKP